MVLGELVDLDAEIRIYNDELGGGADFSLDDIAFALAPPVDECALGTHNCDANATCTNTPDSFTCTCNPGYSGDGVTCTDDDECIGNPCDTNATCTNSPGSFTCACNAGYTGDGFACTPVCTGPVATAYLELMSGGDDGDDDDEGRFVVDFGFSNQADACDPTTCVAEIVCGNTRIAVALGEVVEIENDDEGCEVELEDNILEIEGPNVFLEVTCANSAGIDTAQALPIGIGPDNDSDSDPDD